MYLFVKPASDITTNGEVMISLSIVAINIAFFLYAALLLYRSFKEYAVEKLYTTGETDDETRRIQAHLAALTDEQREMIARGEQQQRETIEQQQLERRRGSIVNGGGDLNEGGIEMANRRRASVAMFGGNVDGAAHSLPSVQAHRGTTVRIGRRVSVSGWQSAADLTAQMQPNSTAALSSIDMGSVGIELATITRASAAATLDSVVCIDDSHERLPPIAVDRDGCVSIEAALSHARPLDLVAFVDRRATSNRDGDDSASSLLLLWTHVGVVVDQELLAGGIENGRAGELYVLEAVRMQTGSAGDGKDEPCNVETGLQTGGVQIRSLREACPDLFHGVTLAFLLIFQIS